LTIGSIKKSVFERVGGLTAPVKRQRLWWNGYLLDCNDKSLKESCVGVNVDEKLADDCKDLTIFLTVNMLEDDSFLARPRSNSDEQFEKRFDNRKNKDMNVKRTRKESCLVS